MTDLENITKLTRDLAKAAKTLTPREARYLVDAYYLMQEHRIAVAHQIRALKTSGEPHEVLVWFVDQFEMLENQVKRALDRFSEASPLGEWTRSIIGIGPVIAAGLMAHIDIEKAPTVGHIWRYAGLDPTSKWNKGEKRPWNGQLKTLCWLIGESFVKVSGNPKSLYGRLYVERKAYEQAKNDAGDYKEQAAERAQRVGKNTDAYKHYAGGKLSPGHVHSRAKRYAVKLFLAHYHHKAYVLHYDREPPAPYPLAHLGHVHAIEPEN